MRESNNQKANNRKMFLWFRSRTVVYAQHQVLTRYIWKIRFHNEGLASLCLAGFCSILFYSDFILCRKWKVCPSFSTTRYFYPKKKGVYRSVGQNHFVGEMCVFFPIFSVRLQKLIFCLMYFPQNL